MTPSPRAITEPETKDQRAERLTSIYVNLATKHGAVATIRFLVECIVDLQSRKKKP